MNAKLVTTILVALGAAVFGPSAQAGLGKPPPDCTGKNDPSPCLVKGGGGETFVSPHIVRVGQKFTATLESMDGEYGGVYSWQDPFIGGAKLLSCTGKQVPKKGDQWTADKGLGGRRRCEYKATSATGWQVVRFGFNVRYGGLASMDDDALAIVGKNEHYISGEVRSKPYPGSPKEGVPIRGMRVGVFSAAGRKSGGYAFSRKVTTNNAGFWEVRVPKTGGYDVLPYLRDGDRKVKPKAELDPGTRKVAVSDSTDPKADFELERALGISAEIHSAKGGAISTAKADGLSSGRLIVEVVSPNDDPVPGMEIDLKVNGTSAAGAPHAKICDATGGTRYWPGASWGPDVVPTSLKTDASGRIVASVFFGTDPGTLRITASVPGNARLFDSAEVRMETDAPLAAMGPASLAKALWGAMANQASNGWSLDGKALGLLTTDLGGPADASRAMAAYLSSVRNRFDGVEFAPVQAGSAYGVAFWPSGRVVQSRSGVLDLPASALVIPGTNLGALIQLGKRAGSIVSGYTAQSIPGVEAWRAQAGGGAIRVESAGIPFGLYGGGPYAGGAIAASGCIGN